MELGYLAVLSLFDELVVLFVVTKQRILVKCSSIYEVVVARQRQTQQPMTSVVLLRQCSILPVPPNTQNAQHAS